MQSDWNTKDVGSLTELAVAFALRRNGFDILAPILCDNLRYDLAVEIDRTLYRIQCRTAHLNDKGTHSLRFNCSSSHYHCKDKVRKSYIGQAELFGIYYPINEKCYLVPVAGVGTNCCDLYLEDNPRLLFTSRIAKNYEIIPGRDMEYFMALQPRPKPITSCHVCGKQNSKYLNQTCSKKCRLAERTLFVQNDPERPRCPQCGGFRQRTDKVYCSKKCWLDYRRGNPATLTSVDEISTDAIGE